jgi:hypothetical protein
MVLTFFNIIASYYSAKVIDESNLNNQRAYIFFNAFFDSKKTKIMTVEEVNDIEKF